MISYSVQLKIVNFMHFDYNMFTFTLPSIHFYRLNLLIIFNQNLHIIVENDYNYGKILSSYSLVIRFIMESTCNQ